MHRYYIKHWPISTERSLNHVNYRIEMRYTADTPGTIQLWVRSDEQVRTSQDGQMIAELNSRNFKDVVGTEEPGWGYAYSVIRQWWIGDASCYVNSRGVTHDEEQAKQFCRFLIEKVTEVFPACELCEEPGCTVQPDDHPTCNRCSEFTGVRSTYEFLTYISCDGAVETIQTLCLHCYDTASDEGITCGETGYNIASDEEVYTDDGLTYCQTHYDIRYFYCTWCDCETRVRQRVTTYDGDNVCRGCADEEGIGTGGIHSWDYRPELVFHPMPPTDPQQPLFIGMELETSFSGSGWQDAANSWLMNPKFKDLIYAKSDSSVRNGFEIVTHPMEPRWALDNFPFDAFADLVDTEGRLRALPTHPSCGTHMHMNKEAFTTSHLWKFLQIHFRMPDFCKLVGGRGDGTYASFTIPDMQVQRERLAEIAKAKGKLPNGAYIDRYVAVNLRNEYTVELRYMAGGSDPASIKKNLQWGIALYEFSNRISVKAVREGALDNSGFFLQWIHQYDLKNGGIFKELKDHIEKFIPRPAELIADAANGKSWYN